MAKKRDESLVSGDFGERGFIEMNIEKRNYTEKELVYMLCTPAQIQSYEQRNKFVGGKQRSMFLDRLAQYCSYDYDQATKSYNITALYDVPKTMAQSRLHKGIYQYLAPLILHEMINNHDENHKARLTVFDLAEKIAMVNSNYKCLKYNMEQVEDELDIPFYTVYEYFNKTDLQIDEYLRRCIKYLSSENCVIANEVHVIQTFKRDTQYKDDIGNHVEVIKVKDAHVATDEEMDLYARLIEEASKISGAYTNYEQWYGVNSNKFKRALKKLLDQNGIDYVCRGFEMWYVDLDKCKQMLHEYSDISLEDRTKMLGEVFKLLIDENAAKRAEKKSLIDTGYVEHFQSLSSITILHDAEDIRKQIKSWKSQSERLMEKANTINVEYREYKNTEGG